MRSALLTLSLLGVLLFGGAFAVSLVDPLLIERAAREVVRIQAEREVGEKIESAYASVARALLREFRIFAASNAAAFALLGVVTLIRGRAALQLLLPALVLVGSVQPHTTVT